MSRTLRLVTVIGALVVNGAAVHDIRIGEPNVRAEWAVVVLSAVLAIAAFRRHLRGHT